MTTTLEKNFSNIQFHPSFWPSQRITMEVPFLFIGTSLVFLYFSTLLFQAFFPFELTWYIANADVTEAPVSLSRNIEWCDEPKEGNQKRKNFNCVNI